MFKRDSDQRTTLLEAFFIGVIICGSAAIIYTTGRSIGVDIGRDEISAREHYEAEKESALSACVYTETTAFRECVVKATETAQDQAETRQDLYAQQDMSRWAFWMMIISGLTFLVTGLGIVWIKETLVETRRAVNSADDAVEVTREVGRAQTRAYLSVHKASYFRNGKPGKEGHNYVRLTIKNSGNSPARNVKVRATGISIEGNVDGVVKTPTDPKRVGDIASGDDIFVDILFAKPFEAKEYTSFSVQFVVSNETVFEDDVSVSELGSVTHRVKDIRKSNIGLDEIFEITNGETAV